MRFARRLGTACLICLAVAPFDAADAQSPFGFFQPTYRRTYRPKRRVPPARPPKPSSPRPSQPVPAKPVPQTSAPPEAPMPPPRPALPAAPASVVPPARKETFGPFRPATVSPAPGPTSPPKSGAAPGPAPRSPDADATCPGRLKARGVTVETTTIGPQPDARCTVVDPVQLSDMTLADGSKVVFPDHPTIACVTADTFSRFIGDLVAPLAKGTFGASLASVGTGPGLECRSRDHIAGAKLSAHGQGLAIDIAQLKLTDGRLVAVGDPKSLWTPAFDGAVRAAGCGYFHTVLGPGADSFHSSHWHLDLEVRGPKGDSKFCQ